MCNMSPYTHLLTSLMTKYHQWHNIPKKFIKQNSFPWKNSISPKSASPGMMGHSNQHMLAINMLHVYATAAERNREGLETQAFSSHWHKNCEILCFFGVPYAKMYGEVESRCKYSFTVVESCDSGGFGTAGHKILVILDLFDRMHFLNKTPDIQLVFRIFSNEQRATNSSSLNTLRSGIECFGEQICNPTILQQKIQFQR